MLWGHYSHDNNRHQTTDENQEQAQILEIWYDPVTKDDDANTSP